MRISERIDLKKYILFSLFLFALFVPFFHQKNEVLILLVTYVAVLVNQFMLVYAIKELIEPTVQGKKTKNFRVMTLFLGKSLILVLGLIFGVQMIQSRVIIPVIFYVCQIFVLIFSSRKSLIKKDHK